MSEQIEGYTAQETENLLKEIELKRLKEEIAEYDYIGIKIAMGVATKDEYAEEIEYTEKLRDKIRELEE